MSSLRTRAGRVPAPALVLAAVVSVQTGAALAKSLFADLGPTGATAVRLLSGTVLLLVIWRPRLPECRSRHRSARSGAAAQPICSAHARR